MFHDVVENCDYDSSGFPGSLAARYKLKREDFEAHLGAIRQVIQDRPVDLVDQNGQPGGRCPLLLTFDDGGLSAYTVIAGLLERHRWRGHFFITADYINRPGFLTPQQIRKLRDRGHRIGAHSCSHPTRMSHCSREELRREWGASIQALSQILDEPVRVASVPGGYYSRPVAEAAAAVGIQTLFTSEPTAATHLIDGCLVLGRYVVQRNRTPAFSAAIASGRLAPRLQQSLAWNLKKAAKLAGGPAYLKLRKLLLAD